MTWKLSLLECDSEPLVPVTVIEYVPAVDPVHDNVEFMDPLLESVTLAGPMLQLSPTLGEIVSERLTVPAKPFRLDTMIFDAVVAPTFADNEDGLELIVKSGAAPTV